MRHCDGTDPHLQNDAGVPCVCGLRFDDVKRMVVYPHEPVGGEPLPKWSAPHQIGGSPVNAAATPGPWRWGDDWKPETFGDPADEYSGEKYADLRLVGADGSTVIPLGIDHHQLIVDARRDMNIIGPANRALIAAAPTLLVAAREAKAAIIRGFNYTDALGLLNEAIAQAAPEPQPPAPGLERHS